MALIASLVESVVAALGGVAQGFLWKPEDRARDIGELAGLWKEKVEEFAAEHPTLTAVGAFSSPATLVLFTTGGLGDPKKFVGELLGKYSVILHEVFGLLNVEIPQGAGAPAGNLAAQIAGTLEQGRIDSQERVTAAVTLINFIVITGSAISVAAELLTLGQLEGISSGIQSWVWANGLGSFSPMAFTPQLNASVNPYLTRYYNSRAQAQIPAVGDIIRFQLREVFLEGRREELVGTEDRPIYNALMKEQGYNAFHADSYWGAHWDLPSQGALNEMLHRGIIGEETWERFTRFNDVEPTTIPWLKDVIFNPYTRVDVRRMARFGLLDEGELLQAYADLGFYAPTALGADGRYRAQYVNTPDFTVHKAQALVVFTRVFNAIPTLRQRYSKGWASPEEVLEGLRATGIPDDKAREYFETIVRDEGPARTQPEKSLTRALVARAWKLRLVSFPQALFLLERMGWTNAEADLILRVQSIPDDPLAFVGTELGFRLGGGVFAAEEPIAPGGVEE